MSNQSIDVVQVAVGDYDYELTQTRRVLEAIPNDKLDYKPNDKAWSLLGLAHHVAQLPFLFTAVVDTAELDFATAKQPPASKSVDDLLRLFDATAAGARDAIKRVTPETLTQSWTFKYGDRVIFANRNKAATLRSFAISHLIHHRAQLTVYLRELGAKVPGMYGPTSDDM
jgi:uncharacterized damage-inducible protein DinB